KRSGASAQGPSVGGFRRVESYRPSAEKPRLGNFEQSDGDHAEEESYMSVRGAAALPLPHKSRPKRLKLPGFPRRKKATERKQSKSRRFTVKRAVLVVLFLLLAIGGYIGWKFYSNTSRVLDGNLFGFFDSSAKLRGEENGRVNILLAGNS